MNILDQLKEISISAKEVETMITYLTEVVDGYDELLQQYDEAISDIKAGKAVLKPNDNDKELTQEVSLEEMEKIKAETIETHEQEILDLTTVIQKLTVFKEIFKT